MKLEVFNVEHGACALLTCDDGQRIMIDCGDNTGTGWKPGTHLQSIGVHTLRSLFVTNYDEDHVSGIRDLFDRVNVQWIFRNQTVSPQTIQALKSDDGMGVGIAFLVGVLKQWAQTGSAIHGTNALALPSNISINCFCNSYPDFVDENNLSVAVEVICNGTSFMFTGDLEKSGWEKLIERADVRAALGRVQVFFASHHGRESGCCDAVFGYCQPRFVVISDKAKGFQTQETHAYYRARAGGGIVLGQTDKRYVLTTRSDGNITFEISPNGDYTVAVGSAASQFS